MMILGKQHIAKKVAIVMICLGILVLIASSIYLILDVQIVHRYYAIRHQTDVNMIQGWMTPYYIASAYDVPEQLLLDVTSTTSLQAKNQSISTIAKMHNESTTQLINTVRFQILQYKKAHNDSTPTAFQKAPLLKQ